MPLKAISQGLDCCLFDQTAFLVIISCLRVDEVSLIPAVQYKNSVNQLQFTTTHP